MIYSLLSKLEQNIYKQSEAIIDVFTAFQYTLAANITTAQEVVNMVNFKNAMVIEMASLNEQIARQKRCVLFLLVNNDLNTVLLEPVDENGDIV